jgi:DNA topoisomerase-1
MPEVKAEPEPIDRMCPECGNQLVIRHGRYGKFIGCSTFPECRHTEPWLEKIGGLCPLDGGELVERRTRKGRTFYGCSNYPECEFTSWKRPESAPCPNCGGLLVHQNRKHLQCLDCENLYEHEEIHTEEPDKEPDLA